MLSDIYLQSKCKYYCIFSKYCTFYCVPEQNAEAFSLPKCMQASQHLKESSYKVVQSLHYGLLKQNPANVGRECSSYR